MNSKTLTSLAVATVILAGLAMWLSGSREAVHEREGGEMLFPGLMDRINDVSSVQVTDAATGDVVTLTLDGERWGVGERGGYPATLTELRRQLITLAEARLVEKKTANPEFYSRLGVVDPSVDGATSRLVVVELDGKRYEAIVGDLVARGQTSTFVRRNGEAQSWAASGNLRLDVAPTRWLERAVVDIPTPTVRRVVIEHPDGSRLEVSKDEPGLPNFAVNDLPPGRELLSPSAGNSIAGALASLQLEDVMARDAFPGLDDEATTAVFETFDGRRATVKAWLLDDVRYVSVDLAFDASLVTAAPAADVAAPDGAALPQPAEESEVAAAADRISGYVFAIPSYKFSNLTKRLEDLLKPVESDSDSDAAEL